MENDFLGNPDLHLNLFPFQDPIMPNLDLRPDEDELVALTPTAFEHLTGSEESPEFSDLITFHYEPSNTWDWDTDTDYWDLAHSTPGYSDWTTFDANELSPQQFRDEQQVDPACLEIGLTVLAEDGKIERVAIPLPPSNIETLISEPESQAPELTQPETGNGQNEQHTSKKTRTWKRRKCPDCCYTYDPISADYAAHRRRVHEGIKHGFQCGLCVKAFQTRIELQTHEYWHRGVHPFPCEVEGCGKRFRNKRQRGVHTKIHHPERLPHVCELCGNCFYKKCNYDTHLRKHAKEKQFSCNRCGQVFRQKGNFMYHRRLCRARPTPVRYPCPQCDQSFSSTKSLRRHQMKKHGEAHVGFLTCDQCGYIAAEGRGRLKRHISTVHMKLSPQKCSVCNEEVQTKASLLAHAKEKHRQNNSFVCSECQKQFSMFSRLETHFVTHSKVKNFNCAICNKQYGTRSILQRHYRGIHKIPASNYPN